MFIFQGKLYWEVASDVHVATDETVTIVIPRSTFLGDPVQVFWQWTVVKDAQEKTNVEVYLNGTIDAFLSPTQFRFRDNSESDYRFEATLIDNHATGTAELNLVMSNQAGVTQGPFVLRRPFELKTDVRDFLYPSLPAPRIYLGKLNWWRYARDELFVIVCPSRIEEGSPVCAFWQWTETQDGSKKKSSAVVSPYEDVANGDHGLTFRFQNAGKHYSWTCEINEDTNELDVHMTSQSGGKADCTLRLLDVESGHPLQPDPPAIVNDTDDLVFCSTRSDGAYSRGRSPSISDFIPVVIQQHNSFAEYDWAMKVAATAIASTRAADLVDASELPTSQILYPHTFLARRSSGGWLDPTTELSLARLQIDVKNQMLKLQVGRIPGTGTDTLKLSDLFAGRSPITMEILSSLSIKTSHGVGLEKSSLVAKVIHRIPGLKPAPFFAPIKPSRYGGASAPFSIDKSQDKSEDDTTLTFYPRVWDQAMQNDTPSPVQVFSFDPSTTFFSDPKFCFQYQLPNGGWYTLLSACKITPLEGSNIGRKLGKASSQTEALAIANKTPGAWAYSWTEGDVVWAWYPTSADSLKIDCYWWPPPVPFLYIYFLIHRLNEVHVNYVIEKTP